MTMVFKLKTLLNLVRSIQPRTYFDFRRIFHAIETPAERQAIADLYQWLEPLNFSKDLVEKIAHRHPERISVLPVSNVYWSDWGSPQRIRPSNSCLRAGPRGVKKTLQSMFKCLAYEKGRSHVLWERRFGNNIRVKKSSQKGEASMNRYSHATNWTTAGIFILFSLAMILWSQDTAAQMIRSKGEASHILAIEKLAVKDGTVSGEVHNLSPNTLRDVQLYIHYIWLWDNEFHPGKNDPGTSFVYTLPQEIAPGAHVPFSFSPSPPLPKVSGGRFMTVASEAGFTEVIPAKR
jgi:hypothetical protein